MELLKAVACRAIDDNARDLKELGAAVWMYAETGGREMKTSCVIRNFLKDKGFSMSSYKGMRTSFKAEWGEGEFGGAKRPNIGFLCRYDASYNGHVRGNNLVVEVTIGAALGVQEAIRASTSKIGKVTIIGCPNSAKHWLVYLLNWKQFKDLDVVLSATPGPRTVWNPVYLGSKVFRATYKTGDVQQVSAPEALAGSIFAITNILTVQEHFDRGWKTEGIISDGGNDARQTPLHCEATVRITAPNNVGMALLEKRTVPCLEAASTTTRCLLNLDMASKSIYSMLNNTLLGYCLQLNAYHSGVLSTPLKPRDLVLGPEDVGNLSLVLPSVRPMYYVGTDEEVGTPAFRDAVNTETAHHYTVAMAKALAMTALDVMISSETLSNVKEEHCRNVRAIKEVKFEPFAVSKSTELPVVPLPLPQDSNSGWSKIM
ncbi:hypothetical protein BsWGS_21392 [Bradybaena similaris]